MSNLLNIINEIQYGYLDKDNIIHKGNDNEWFSKYKLQFKEEILTNMVGNCYDVTELLRSCLENTYKVETFFMMIAIPYKNNYPTHSYLVYIDNNGYNLIENKFGLNEGIHVFKTREEVIKYQVSSYLKLLRNIYNLKEDDEKHFAITSFDKPKSGISASSYIDNALSSPSVLTLIVGKLNFESYEEKN